ncbi:hypothetical protein BGX24_009474 [Mortierella sp. AD032]|nr:hypothetical protein BGX24_009474 [Mortierella sp. AD032]
MRLSAFVIAVAVIAAVQAERDPRCVIIGGRIICYNKANPATASASSTIVEPEPCKIGGGRRCEYLVEPSAAVVATEPEPCKGGFGRQCEYLVEPSAAVAATEPEPCRGGFGRQCEYLVEPSAAVAAIEPATIKADEPEPCKSGGGRRCQYLVKPSVTAGAVETTGDANIKSCKLVRGNLWCLCGPNEWCPAF